MSAPHIGQTLPNGAIVLLAFRADCQTHGFLTAWLPWASLHPFVSWQWHAAPGQPVACYWGLYSDRLSRAAAKTERRAKRAGMI